MIRLSFSRSIRDFHQSPVASQSYRLVRLRLPGSEKPCVLKRYHLSQRQSPVVSEQFHRSQNVNRPACPENLRVSEQRVSEPHAYRNPTRIGTPRVSEPHCPVGLRVPHQAGGRILRFTAIPSRLETGTATELQRALGTQNHFCFNRCRFAIVMPDNIDPIIPRNPWSVPQRNRFFRCVVPSRSFFGAP